MGSRRRSNRDIKDLRDEADDLDFEAEELGQKVTKFEDEVLRMEAQIREEACKNRSADVVELAESRITKNIRDNNDEDYLKIENGIIKYLAQGGLKEKEVTELLQNAKQMAQDARKRGQDAKKREQDAIKRVIEEKKKHIETLKGSIQKCLNSAEDKRELAEALQDGLITAISGETTRGKHAVENFRVVELNELIPFLEMEGWQSEDISNFPSRIISEESHPFKESELNKKWALALSGLELRGFVTIDSSHCPLFASLDKPDASIIHIESFLAQLMSSPGGNNALEGHNIRDFLRNSKLTGWSFLFALIELKICISKDGKTLSPHGLRAASQIMQRLKHMEHCSIALIADSEYMARFIEDPKSKLERARRRRRRSKILPLRAGAMHLQRLLKELGEGARASAKPRKRRLAQRGMTLGLQKALRLDAPLAIDILRRARKKDGADICAVSGRGFPGDELAVKSAADDGSDGASFRARSLERERRRILALSSADAQNAPRLPSRSRRLATGAQERDLIRWRGAEGKRYVAMIAAPLAKGGALGEQRFRLRNRADGGLALCHIMLQAALALRQARDICADGSCGMLHGGIKSDSAALPQPALESADPRALAIDWEHSIQLRRSADERQIGQVSLPKKGSSSTSVSAKESPAIEADQHAPFFAPEFCARGQQSGATGKNLGRKADWEALLLTFARMIDRSKMPWLEPPAFRGYRSGAQGFAPRSLEAPLVMKSSKAIEEKRELLEECQEGAWGSSSAQQKWAFGAWDQSAAESVKQALQNWASWALDDESDGVTSGVVFDPAQSLRDALSP